MKCGSCRAEAERRRKGEAARQKPKQLVRSGFDVDSGIPKTDNPATQSRLPIGSPDQQPMRAGTTEPLGSSFNGDNVSIMKTSQKPEMSEPSHQKWNYFVLNINIEAAPSPPNPEEASKKLKGTLSPSFIQDQFPKEYKEVHQGEAMEVQLQKNLDRLGSQGWELINISTIGPKLLFFFKRLDKDVTDED